MAVQTLNLADVRSSVDDVDVFLCSSSFEDRCRSIPDQIEPGAAKHVLVMENKNLSRYVRGNADYLRARFGERSRIVAADTTKPLITAHSITTALNQVRTSSPQTYLLDITAITHESLLILLQTLRLSAMPGDRIRLCYCNAAEYAVGLPMKQKWLSKGADEVRSVLGYPGEVLLSRKNHLVMLVGYEHERASKMIEMFEPDMISLGYGKSSSQTSRKHLAASRHFGKLVKDTAVLYANVASFRFSCSDPWDVRDRILRISRRSRNYNTILAPLNTKLSTVGCALAAFQDDRIQLCYAPARLYNYAGYSAPGDMVYTFDLPELVPA